MNGSTKSLLAATVVASAVAGCASVEPYSAPAYGYGYDYRSVPYYGYDYAPYYGYDYAPYYGYAPGYVAPPVVGFGFSYSNRDRHWRDNRGRGWHQGSYRPGGVSRSWNNQAGAPARAGVGPGRPQRNMATAPAQRFGGGRPNGSVQPSVPAARTPRVAGSRTPDHG
jgi:hypothetical protein